MAGLLAIGVFREHPPWALEDVHADKVRRVAGSRFEVFQAHSLDELNSRIGDVEILYGFRINEAILPLATSLKWVQSTSAGVDGALFPAFVESPVILTSASGIHAIQISEHALAMMLSYSRNLPHFTRRQMKKDWDRSVTADEMDELFEKTLGIVGLGAIGEALAVRAKAFGMRVIGVKNSPLGYSGVADEVVGPGAMERVFAESDFVVCLLPLTSETAGIVSAGMISAMKPTSLFLNFGRGATVDQEALVVALRYGKIAGAALDVFAEEPLPKNSRLWKMENVSITPHVAGMTPRYWERATALFCENLRRYMAGGELLNVVDKEIGY